MLHPILHLQLLCLLLFLQIGSAFPPSAPNPKRSGKALYLTTNSVQNSVVALSIAKDGTLNGGKITGTAGAGLVAVNSTGQPVVDDGLFSQSALTITGKYVFAVNSGSSTLSMFSISEQDPTELQLVGEPVSLPGEFPNTVAASASSRLACVGMTGAKAGVSCASFSHQGLRAMDALRPFDLGQTTPPAGPSNTVSQTLFSEDEGFLFAIVKSNPTTNSSGFVASFPVEKTHWQHAQVATEGVTSTPEDTAVLFGTVTIPGTSNLFATDASFGAAVLSVDGSGTTALIDKGEIEGQMATCWAIVSPKTSTGFTTDVLRPVITEMSLTDASIIASLDLSATGNPGFLDMAAAGNFVYALSPGDENGGASVAVLDVSGGPGTAKLIQFFELGSLGVTSSMQGLAVLM